MKGVTQGYMGSQWQRPQQRSRSLAPRLNYMIMPFGALWLV